MAREIRLPLSWRLIGCVAVTRGLLGDENCSKIQRISENSEDWLSFENGGTVKSEVWSGASGEVRSGSSCGFQ
eukprot:scaffold1160_cov261-Pinguiococcus_pyrenoidosus.AAC.1